MRNIGLALALSLACCMRARVAGAQSISDAPPPAAAAPDEIAKLVGQLNDPDFHVRRDAANRLRDLGPAALPELRKAAASNVPELRDRASVLVQVLERHPLPGRPRSHSRSRSATYRVLNGHTQVYNIDDDGRQVRISHGPNGIEMVVSGEVNGRPATETYHAATTDELRSKDPEAFALYERIVRQFGIEDDAMLGMPNFGQLHGNIIILPQQRFQPLVVTGGDDLRALRAKLDADMDAAHLPPNQRQRVQDAVDKIETARQFNGAGNLNQDRQIEQYDRACDELRKVATELKLPDPGDALPPPKSARLGVSVLPNAAGEQGIVVAHVVANSRADRLGIQDDDLIRRINGKPVHDVGELREMVTKQPKGLVVEITRDGREITLREN